MDALSTLVGIEAISDESGLSAEDVAFLNDKGFSSIRLSARAANSVENFIERLVDPYVHGVFVGSTEHKSSRDAEITEAIFLVVLEQAKARRDREPTVTSARVLPPAPVRHEPPASTLKAPTLLSAADWQHGVDRWEAQWFSPRRNFPSNLILGSELVLARLLWERRVSRSFTPLGLTEIVSTRAYNVDNAINLNRVERPHGDAAIRITATGVESECASTWDSELACKWDTADAIDANSWAWRWAEYASDAMAE